MVLEQTSDWRQVLTYCPLLTFISQNLIGEVALSGLIVSASLSFLGQWQDLSACFLLALCSVISGPEPRL